MSIAVASRDFPLLSLSASSSEHCVWCKLAITVTYSTDRADVVASRHRMTCQRQHHGSSIAKIRLTNLTTSFLSYLLTPNNIYLTRSCRYKKCCVYYYFIRILILYATFQQTHIVICNKCITKSLQKIHQGRESRSAWRRVKLEYSCVELLLVYPQFKISWSCKIWNIYLYLIGFQI